jgi:hypothetical protein
MKQFNSFLVQHVGVSANTPEFLPRDAAQDHRVSRELLFHSTTQRSAFETAVFQVTDMKSTVSCSSFRRGRVSTFLSGVSPDLCDS